MNDFDEIVNKIRGLKSALICTHISPDADAIGSSCALQLGLAKLGINASVYLPKPVPENLSPLIGSASITHEVPQNLMSGIVTVDTAARRRIGSEVDAVLASGEISINIDHHPSNPGWADLNYIREDAASSTIIIWDLLCALEISVDEVMADLLLAGLMDDTGCFRFSNTRVSAFECAAALLNAGANPERIANKLYFSLPERVLRLQAALIAEMRVEFDGKLSLGAVSKEMLNRCGAKAEDTEGLVEILRKIDGTLCAVFFKELDSGWKLSLRSKSEDLDVNSIAQKFGGGGHRQAAGCEIEGTLQEIEQRVLAEFSTFF